MRSRVALLGRLLALVTVSHAQLGQKCDINWMEYGGSCYQLSHGGFVRKSSGAVTMVEGLTQRQANQFCMQQKQGASLVTVNSPGENDHLLELALRTYIEPPAMWIGLFVNTSKQWEWYSGESLDYTNWSETTLFTESGTGALLFDADSRLQEQGAFDVSARWVPEQVLGESHYFICEYKLQMQIPAPEAPAAAAEQPSE